MCCRPTVPKCLFIVMRPIWSSNSVFCMGSRMVQWMYYLAWLWRPSNLLKSRCAARNHRSSVHRSLKLHLVRLAWSYGHAKRLINRVARILQTKFTSRNDQWLPTKQGEATLFDETWTNPNFRLTLLSDAGIAKCKPRPISFSPENSFSVRWGLAGLKFPSSPIQHHRRNWGRNFNILCTCSWSKFW